MIRRKFIFFIIVFSYACASDLKEEVRSYFDDLLLVVNFNHPHYENIRFLKEIYSPFFKNIVFYGEKSHPGVQVVSTHQGWYAHRVIQDAIQRWPHYQGYIYCQDDCWMNLWNYPCLDKDKIWFHTYFTASFNTAKHWWSQWNYPYGRTAALEANKKLPPRAAKILGKNCGTNAFAFSWADFVYLPQKYAKEFVRVSKCFVQPDVFVEIALPTILLSLEKFDQMEKIKPYWGGSIQSIDLSAYKTDFDWVHPIKFSVKENRQFIRKIVSDYFQENKEGESPLLEEVQE